MPTAAATISVVIVTYNSNAVLGRCLGSLTAGCAGARLVDVVIADNASKQDPEAVTRDFPELPVRVVHVGRNAGYAAGINAGVAAVSEGVDAVMVLNPDITVRPGAITLLAAALRDGPAGTRRGIVAPRLVNPDGSLQPSLRRAPTLARAVVESVIGGNVAGRIGRLSELILDPRRYERAGSAVWATGAAMLISMRAWRDVGPWDETFLLYGEETEFALRAGDRGWELWYEPDAVMEHVAGDAFRTSPMLAALAAVNRVKLFRERNGMLRGAAYHLAVTFGVALRALAGRRTARAAMLALLVPSRRLRALPN